MTFSLVFHAFQLVVSSLNLTESIHIAATYLETDYAGLYS